MRKSLLKCNFIKEDTFLHHENDENETMKRCAMCEGKNLMKTLLAFVDE